MLAQEYELKEPIHIKRERVIRLNKYAIQRYCILCQNLYDEKIISNPSVFNYMDFFEYLYDNYNKECLQLLGNSNKMQRNTLYLEYIISKLDNTNFKRLISIYKDILECEEILDLCQDFVGKPNKVVIDISPRYYFSKGFNFNCTINLNNRNILYLLNLREKSLNKYYLSALEKRVESSGIILDNQKEDEKYIDLILTGAIKGTTEYAQKVDSYLTGLNYELTKDELFLDIREEVIKEIESPNMVFFNNSSIYYKAREKDIKFPEYVGTFIHDYNNEGLSMYNCLDGYNGEFITEEEVQKKGYYTKGFPVSLYKYNGRKRVKYYPMFAVYTKYNLEYPLNPRYTDVKRQKIRINLIKYKDIKQQKYFKELRDLIIGNIGNKIINENYNKVVKVPENLDEDKKQEVKKQLCNLLE